MKFNDFLIERRRGVILSALAGVAHDTEAASDMLHKYCLAVGLRPTRDAVDSDLRWLADRRLVLVTERDGFVLAKITQDGHEVAARRASVAGVDIAAPGA